MRVLGAAVAAGAIFVGLGAAEAAAPSQDQLRAEVTAAWQEAGKTATRGPADITLLDQAHLHIPAGEAFIPAAPANRLMRALGNTALDNRFGLVVPTDEKSHWIADIEWVKEGYVRDGDAKEWQPDAMLDELRKNTEAENPQRIARGFPEMDVIGWVQPPSYDAKEHRLIWSMALRERDAAANIPQTINYNTYALGREGFVSLDLLTGSDTIGTDKAVARQLLAGLTFVPGKTYADFNGSTDKVAAYGLAALVGVVAVKKLGLMAVIGVFLLKIWKIGLLALAAGGAAIRRLFGKREEPPAAD